jgi:hypothetical protein
MSIPSASCPKRLPSARFFVSAGLPDTAQLTARAGESNYLPIGVILSGEDYLSGAPTRRPDLQRRSADVLATHGPRVEAIQRGYAEQYGWTANPAAWVWKREGFPGRQVTPFPSPPAPWRAGERAGGLAEPGAAADLLDRLQRRAPGRAHRSAAQEQTRHTILRVSKTCQHGPPVPATFRHRLPLRAAGSLG